MRAGRFEVPPQQAVDGVGDPFDQCRRKRLAAGQVHEEPFHAAQITGGLEDAVGGDHAPDHEAVGLLSEAASPLCDAGGPAGVGRVGPSDQPVDVVDVGLGEDAGSRVVVRERPDPGLPVAVEHHLRLRRRVADAAGRIARPDVPGVRLEDVQQPVVHV
jgi:hypothetical protein